MAETLSVVAQLSAVDKNFTSVFGKADKATQSLGSRIKSGIGFGMLMSVGQKAMSVISGSIDSAISRVDTLANFPKVMKAMGYAEKDVAAASKTMDDGINGLPTTMDGITKSTQMLTASLGNVKKGASSAVALNDMFLAGGQGAEAASRALMQYNQMLAKGKVDQQSWNTLVEVAPGQMKQLAESMLGAGKSQKDLYDALQGGKISLEEFNDAIIKLDKEGGNGFDSFAKQARESTKGIATSMQNCKTAVTKGMANVITALDQALADNGLLGFTGLFDKAKDKINSVFGSIKDGTGIVGRIPGIVGKAIDTLKRFWNTFKETGAVSAFKSAVSNVGSAVSKVFSALSGHGGTIEMIADALGNLVTMLSNAASAAAKFISKLPPGVINGIATAILGTAAGFSVLHTGIGMVTRTANKIKQIKGIFKGLKKGASEGMEGAAQEAQGGVSKIADIIRSLGDLIKSAGSGISTIIKGLGTGIATAVKGIGTGLATTFKGLGTGIANAAKGIGKGISTAFQGIGKGLKMVSPVQLLALGAAIAIVCAGFALLATQGEGVATILNAVGNVLSTVIATVIGAVAQAIVTIAGVVPVICSGLAMLAPLIVAVGEAIGAAAPGIQAFGTAIGTIIESVGNAVATVMPVITDAFTRIVPVVTNAITQIIAAITPLVPSIQGIVETLAPVVMRIVDAFSNVVSQISPILDSISNLVETCFTGISDTVTSIGDSISNVVTAIGDSISGVLDSVAGIFDSIGNAALNAGKGFDLLSKGIKRLVKLPLADMVATLAETASGISDIAASSTGLPELGNGFSKLGKGIQKAAMFGTMAATAFAAISAALIPLQAGIEGLPAALTVCATAFQGFSTSMLAMGVGLVASLASFMSFAQGVAQLVAAMAALTAVGVLATVVMGIITTQTQSADSALIGLSASAAVVGTSMAAMGASVAAPISGFTRMASVGSQCMNKLVQAIQKAGQSAVSAVRTMASGMVSAVTSGLSKFGPAGTTAANKFVNGIKSKNGDAKSAAKGLVDAAITGLSSGNPYQAAYNTGSNISVGLANGMNAGLPAVRAAADALVKEADKAARAKAKVGSPSKLFKEIGVFIGEGFTIGIESMQREASAAIEDLISIPNMRQPQLAFEMAGDARLDATVSYGMTELADDLKNALLDVLENRPIEITNVTELDGREISRVTAPHIEKAINQRQTRENRKKGIL